MELNIFAVAIIKDITYHLNKEQVLYKVKFFEYCLDIIDMEQELIEDHKIMKPDIFQYLAVRFNIAKEQMTFMFQLDILLNKVKALCIFCSIVEISLDCIIIVDLIIKIKLFMVINIVTVGLQIIGLALRIKMEL